MPIHSFVLHIIFEDLLCARLWARHWEYGGDQNIQGSCLHVTFNLEERQVIPPRPGKQKQIEKSAVRHKENKSDIIDTEMEPRS